MSFPPRTRLWAAMALLTVCAIAGGACAGFLLGGWWVAQAGALAGAVTVVLSARITIWLCHLQSQDAWKSIVVGDGRAEGAAEMALWGAILYEAAAFPLAPGGVSTQERRSRRTIAYRMAAYDDLPRPVQVAAAEALDVIDQGQDRKQAQAAVTALSHAVRECRAGYVHIRDDQTS